MIAPGETTEVTRPEVAVWMPAAILQSKGHYELAAEEYSRMVQLSPARCIDFIINQATECYASLADWEALDSWLSQLKQYSRMPPVRNEDYLQALSKFDQGDYSSASG